MKLRKAASLIKTTILFFVVGIVSISCSENEPEKYTNFRDSTIYKIDSLEKIYLIQGVTNNDSLFTLYTKLKLLSNEAEYTPGFAKSYRILSDYHFNNGDYVKSIGSLHLAISDFSKTSDSINIADCFTRLGFIYDRIGSYDSSQVCFERALCIAKSLNLRNDEAIALSNIGMVYDTRGNFSEALNFYFQAFQIFRQQNNIDEQTKTTIAIGNVYRIQNQYERALEYYNIAGTLSKQSENKLYSAEVFHHLGKFYTDIKNYNTALSSYRKALVIKEQLNTKDQIAKIYGNIGHLYYKWNKPDSSLYYHKMALKLRREIKDIAGEATSLNNFGRVALLQKNYNSALTYFTKALELREKIGGLYGISSTMHSIGKVYLEKKQFEKANNFFAKSMVIAKRNNFSQLLLRNYKALSEINSLTGKSKTALNYFREYSSLKDSIFNNKTSEQVTAMHLESQKLDSERELKILQSELKFQRLFIYALILLIWLVLVTGIILWRQYRTNKTMNQNLSAANSMKNLLLDVITHDLKNPIGVINGVSGLMLSENPEDEKSLLINNSCSNMIKVLNNATTLSQISIDEEIEFTKLNLNEELHAVLEEYSQSFLSKNIQVNVSADPEININANPIIGEVFKNIIANAIKYSTNDNKFDINTEIINDRIIVNFRDFGETIPKDKREEIFMRGTRINENYTEGRGLGLAIVRNIAELHGSDYGVKPNQPTGNIFYISFKLVK